MFWFKKKKINVNCFVHENYLYLEKTAPIAPAYKFYPDWWKNLEKEYFDMESMKTSNNMRTCSGFIELFKKGFILPMWSDLAIKTDVNGKLQSYRYDFSDSKSKLIEHHNSLTEGFYPDHWIFKLHSPWIIKADRKNLKFAYLPCTWNHTRPPNYTVPTGMIDEFFIKASTNIFLLIDRTKKQDTFINFGQPMVHYIPITEDHIELRTEVLTDLEFRKVKCTDQITYNRKGINLKRISEGKCPIHSTVKYRDE